MSGGLVSLPLPTSHTSFEHYSPAVRMEVYTITVMYAAAACSPCWATSMLHYISTYITNYNLLQVAMQCKMQLQITFSNLQCYILN